MATACAPWCISRDTEITALDGSHVCQGDGPEEIMLTVEPGDLGGDGVDRARVYVVPVREYGSRPEVHVVWQLATLPPGDLGRASEVPVRLTPAEARRLAAELVEVVERINRSA